MATVKIVVKNSYFHGIIEEFITRVDIADLNEVEMCADECMGAYLEMHHDLIMALTPDLTFEKLAEACYYTLEEVLENGSEF